MLSTICVAYGNLVYIATLACVQESTSGGLKRGCLCRGWEPSWKHAGVWGFRWGTKCAAILLTLGPSRPFGPLEVRASVAYTWMMS